ncbi:MAG: hypothetical protein GX267_15090 [Fibrobacter sp.]|nr:hypothetical protein [Fibrobacter sp.]
MGQKLWARSTLPGTKPVTVYWKIGLKKQQFCSSFYHLCYNFVPINHPSSLNMDIDALFLFYLVFSTELKIK